MTYGLVLGGGGVVGIAWEVGVLDALAQAGVLDVADAATVVSTSAGAVVGTGLLTGQTLDDLVAAQLGPSQDIGGGTAAPDGSAIASIFGALMTATEMTPSLGQQVGAQAMAAPTGPASAWVASFETLLPSADWPSADLRVAALSCTTGERRVWTARDGVPLARAVASSCAVPGMFPTVEIDGDHYTDGGAWSPSNADLLAGEGLDAVVFIGPIGTFLAGTPQIERELATVAAKGAATASILPSEAFNSLRLQLMDPAFRAQGLEIGRADGAAAVAALRAVL